MQSTQAVDRALRPTGRVRASMIATVAVLSALALRSEAQTLISYDASSDLLPQSFGWSFVNTGVPASTISVGGGILTMDVPMPNRTYWIVQMGTSPYPGTFMQSTVRIQSEVHGGVPEDRGVDLGVAAQGNGSRASALVLYGWEDRIFINDITDKTIAEYAMDTTDTFHTYRTELSGEDYVIYVDGIPRIVGKTISVPNPTYGIRFTFGAGSTFSESVSEWKTVLAGRMTLDQTAILSLHRASQDTSLLSQDVFLAPPLQNTLMGKIGVALDLISAGSYTEAMDKLVNDILPKTDGCAVRGAPDRNDWITDCDAQLEVYDLLLQAITDLQNLVD